MLDGYVGRRNQDRFRVREGIKAGFAVVVADAGVSTPPKAWSPQIDGYLLD
jgi:hypothetical protein